MGATADPAADVAAAAKLGFKSGQLVQEYGWDEQVDEDFREAVEELVGSELLDEDADDVADVVICWYRRVTGTSSTPWWTPSPTSPTAGSSGS